MEIKTMILYWLLIGTIGFVIGYFVREAIGIKRENNAYDNGLAFGRALKLKESKISDVLVTLRKMTSYNRNYLAPENPKYSEYFKGIADGLDKSVKIIQEEIEFEAE